MPKLPSVLPAVSSAIGGLERELLGFRTFGKKTRQFSKAFGDRELPYYVNEFWTSKQRASHSLHEVSYRACFKAQLPQFFIERLTEPGDRVYDPFMGRGTTLIESALLNRIPLGCDINPLSEILCRPRLSPPTLQEVTERLLQFPTTPKGTIRRDLLAFYHRDTLKQICALREYLLGKSEVELDSVDRWIRMVATNRLTGHSAGFFSVYTMPPNQAVSVESQIKINEKRGQVPAAKEISPIIIKKTKALLAGLAPQVSSSLSQCAEQAVFVNGSACHTPEIPDNSVHLVVTSPPFLDVVNYKQDNWLRCWFNGIDPDSVNIWHLKRPADWALAITGMFRELDRILRPGGTVAFEVGEVRNGSILLEDLVVPAGIAAGLEPEAILINDQKFTKTSNCWGVDNLKKGTNTNRIVLLSKPA